MVPAGEHQAAILHKCGPYTRTTEEGLELIDSYITNSEQANQTFISSAFHSPPCLPIGLA